MKNNKTNLNAMDRRIYKYWQALYLSFFSSRLYIDVGKRWRGFGLIYFLLVVALAAIPLSIKSIQKFNAYYNEQLIEPIKKIPSFAIQDGRLNFANFMPYLIKNNKDNVVVIIDEKLNLTEVSHAYPQWMIFITTDRMYIRLPHLSFISEEVTPILANTDSKGVEMESFADIQNDYFSGNMWVEHTNLASIKRYMMLSIYPCITMLLFSFFGSFLGLLAIFGKACSYIFFKFRIGYKQTYRLMLVSSGCGISLFVISLSFGRLPGLGFYLMVLIILYFFYAVLSLKRESKSMVLA